MSDSSMYELESIRWDDFEENNDLSVPYSGVVQCAGFNTQGGCRDKLRHRKVAASGNKFDKSAPTKDDILRRQETDHTISDRMAPAQQNGSCSHTCESVCPDVNDANYMKEVTCLTSNDVDAFTNCFKDNEADSLDNDFFKDGAVFDEKDVTNGGNLCHFPLDDIFSDSGHLDFLGDESENKKRDYLAYCEWPDIDKLDEFDRMFRCYDSTFVPGNATNGDNLCLLSSSSCNFDGSEDVLETSFKFSGDDNARISSIPEDKTKPVMDVVGGNCEFFGGLRMELSPADSNVPDSTCTSFVPSEDSSLERAGFRQLESVLEQLDVRTKLCIRDSLYRLARSAKQRNSLGTSDNHVEDVEDKSEVITIEEHDRCTRLADVETHTNSIDRSMAQLLFHRPSDSA